MELKVGMVINSYCNGFFGKNYGEKEVVAWGWDWLVVRVRELDCHPYLAVAEFGSQEQMMEYVEDWAKGYF